MQRRKQEAVSPCLTRYNLCFSYSNRKRPPRRPNPTPSPNPSPHNRRFSESHQPHSSLSSLSEASPIRKTIPKMPTQQMQYIGSSFPQRKKKSGEHQLLKLLVKFTEGLALKKRAALPLHEALHAPKVKAKPKSKSRLLWVKDRYCVNRDKEGGVLPVREGSAMRLGLLGRRQ